jgi:hypothetical protein
MIRVDFGPISETVSIDIIYSSFVEVFPLRHALERCHVLPLFYPGVHKSSNAVVPISMQGKTNICFYDFIKSFVV